jgi:hypothetical protein
VLNSDPEIPPKVKRHVNQRVIGHVFLYYLPMQIAVIPLCIAVTILFSCRTLVMSEIELHHSVVHAAGHVLSSLDTGLTANSQPIYQTQYKYVTEDGAYRTGMSYGHHVNSSDSVAVTVVYSLKHPAISVIEGLHPSTQSLLMVKVAAVVFLLSTAVVLYSFCRSYKLYYLLSSGLSGEASLVKQTRSKRAGLKPPTYQYTYIFKRPERQVKTLTVETHDWLNVSPKVLHTDRWNGYCELTVLIPGHPVITDEYVTTEDRLSQYLALPCVAIVLSVFVFIGMK